MTATIVNIPSSQAHRAKDGIPDVDVTAGAVVVVNTGGGVSVAVVDTITVTGWTEVERYEEQKADASRVLVEGDAARNARRQLSALHAGPARSKIS